MTIYKITVKPGSSQEKIVEETLDSCSEYDVALTVYLRAKPHNGEANDALIKLLSKAYKVPKTHIKLLRGARSRVKTIEI